MKLATIPDDLIFDNILPRLPVKSLLRFKSVSTYWYSTISSPRFQKSHVAFSSRHRSFYVDKTETGRLWLAGSCNGLVGLYSNKPTTLLVFNPATHQRFDVDIPPHLTRLSSTCLYWFGYVSSIDDYKFAAFENARKDVWIHSLKRREWNREHCSFFLRNGGSISFTCPTQVDDSLYWALDVGDVTGESYHTCIIELNLVSEEVEVKPKVDFAKEMSWSSLFNWKGCLVLHQKSESGCIHLWMLRQKDDWNSWEKVYSKVHKDVQLVYICRTRGKMVIHRRDLKREKVIEDLSQLPWEEKDEDGEEGDIPNSKTQNWRSVVGDYYESLIWPL